MSQGDIIKLMEKYPDKVFTSKEISKATKVFGVQPALFTLRVHNEVGYKKIISNGRYKYLYFKKRPTLSVQFDNAIPEKPTQPIATNDPVIKQPAIKESVLDV